MPHLRFAAARMPLQHPSAKGQHVVLAQGANLTASCVAALALCCGAQKLLLLMAQEQPYMCARELEPCAAVGAVESRAKGASSMKA
jgi:hypothetical protein